MKPTLKPPTCRVKIMSKIRIFSLLAAIAVVLFASLASCKKPEPADEGEVVAAAKELLTAAVEVNRVFFGEGLPMGERVAPSVDIGYAEYVPLDEEHIGMSQSDIMDIARPVYAESYCEDIEKIVFEGVKVTDEEALFPRYVEEKGEMKICYLLSVEGLPERVPLVDTLNVLSVGHDTAELSVDTVCEGKKENITVTLVLEKNGWRLNTPTY